MELNEFVKKIEDYYGKYRPAVKREVIRYIASGPNFDFREMYRYLILNETNRFGIPPDIAIIDKARKDMYTNSGTYIEWKPALPDPEARDYSGEIGKVFRKLIGKSRIRQPEAP